jgi:hypothetical protein
MVTFFMDVEKGQDEGISFSLTFRVGTVHRGTFFYIGVGIRTQDPTLARQEL